MKKLLLLIFLTITAGLLLISCQGPIDLPGIDVPDISIPDVLIPDIDLTKPDDTGSAQGSPGLLWMRLSTVDGSLTPPSTSTQQTAALVLDIDRDGINDFVIGIRQDPGPSLVWYRRTETGWDRYLIDRDPLHIEAGGAFHDIDGDGDLDIVMGGDYQSNEIWWWENPYPDFDPEQPWARRIIKNSGAAKHHDQVFGDVTGDGKTELVFWNQDARSLMLAAIPADPKATQPWEFTTIYTWESGEEHEGLALADIDGDGQLDILGGGRWFKHQGGGQFLANLIDDRQRSSRVAAGQLVEGGAPEVVFVPGDGAGMLRWYEQVDDRWIGDDLMRREVNHGHSLDVADINGDGYLDVFVAEMRLDGQNPDAGLWVFLGDGQGNFIQTEVASGYGNHESKIADLDGDGDLDILGKPYNWETPRLDIWLNQPSPFASWQRHVIDDNRPGRAVFIDAGDLDGDGFVDIVSGRWWYRNPGAASGSWERAAIGEPLVNMAAVFDFDGDGHLDVLGTQGDGADANSQFVWGRNDGQGGYTILKNIDAGDGDFLQGVAVGRLHGEELVVALSWHAEGKGVQQLTVPSDPLNDRWVWSQLAPDSLDEGLSAGDIDGDGDLDLLLGTHWLRNDDETWTRFSLSDSSGLPDRNRLADINGDGRLDAVIGYEAISEPGKLAWYEQVDSVTGLWDEHIIADPPVIGPMSLDVADMDGDGDLDIVVGEHHIQRPASARLLIFENQDGIGMTWKPHLVFTGDEHHDGALVVDIDNDSDLDIVSIGWEHNRVLLYENRSGYSAESTGLPPSLSTSPEDCLMDGVIARYDFDEGQGTRIRDVSGLEPALDLVIQDGTVRWLDGGLAVEDPARIVSLTSAEKIAANVRATGEISVEVWVRPATVEQEGPARIISLSDGQDYRNFTLGQGLWGDQPSSLFDMRLRTSTTDLNGMPSLYTGENSAEAALVHVVFARDSAGSSKFFLNGTEAAAGSIPGDFMNWDPTYALVLANELGEDRPWLGEFYHAAIYRCALTPELIQQRFTESLPDANE